MIPTHIDKINQGTFFHLTNSETSPLWVRGEYNRFAQKYECHKYDDVNHEKLISKKQTIYITEDTPHKK